uniref:Uncharacterized protein LOC114347966 n=1 Tax=Diabrotica virgifera virgifera TaxID=50390 RepID=A0A6P7GXE9_DIAVI
MCSSRSSYILSLVKDVKNRNEDDPDDPLPLAAIMSTSTTTPVVNFDCNNSEEHDNSYVLTQLSPVQLTNFDNNSGSHDLDVQDGLGVGIVQPINLLPESEDQPAENIQPEDTREVTKKGTPRIRKKSVLSKQEKHEQKKDKYIKKHDLYPPCQACRLKCIENIPEVRRKQINSVYCAKSWLERRNFMLISTTRHGVKRRGCKKLLCYLG